MPRATGFHEFSRSNIFLSIQVRNRRRSRKSVARCTARLERRERLPVRHPVMTATAIARGRLRRISQLRRRDVPDSRGNNLARKFSAFSPAGARPRLADHWT